MAKQTTKSFIDLVRRSGLIEEDQLAEALSNAAKRHGELGDDPAPLAELLVEMGLLTRWHTEKLLDGKYRGFFLGKYRLLDHLGTGGMSSVYLAEHVLMRRRVAIKVLPRSRVEDSSYLARFHLEARAAAKLDHPNIVRAYDVDNENDTHYIVMEYVEGSDLQTLVKDRGVPEIETAVDYIAQAARGLKHAHEAGLIHRDIKPANLLIDKKGVVKILDMGLARFADSEEASLTIAHDENVLGTADYLAPEQARNSHDVDQRADIYSLGCTLYFALTGHAPFPEGSLAQRIAKHQTEMPRDIREDRPECPKSLVNICTKMMLKNPDRRFQTAAEVADVLEHWLAARGRELPPDAGDSSGRLATAAAAARETLARGGPLPRAKPPRRRTGGGAGDSDRLPNRRPQSLEDTVADRGPATVKGLSPEDPRRSPRRPGLIVAQPLDAAPPAKVFDSGTIDLAPEPAREGSKKAGSSNKAGAAARPAGDSGRTVDRGPVKIDLPVGEGPAASSSAPIPAALESESMSLVDLRRERLQRKASLPLWVWILVGAGALILVVLILVVAMLLGPAPQPPQRPPVLDTAQLHLPAQAWAASGRG